MFISAGASRPDITRKQCRNGEYKNYAHKYIFHKNLEFIITRFSVNILTHLGELVNLCLNNV
jgi:hypothetical protein